MKKILKWFSLGYLLVLLGCRTDEMLNQAQQKDEMAKKFSVFVKHNDNEVIDYAGGFRILAQRYDSLHQTNISGKRHIDKMLELSKTEDIRLNDIEAKPYIDFGIHSQTIIENNGDKWVVFPRIQGGKVKDLVEARLSNDETEVYYYILDYNSDFYKLNIKQFQEAYHQRFGTMRANNNTEGIIALSVCGGEGSGPCDIPEVVIIGKKKKGNDGYGCGHDHSHDDDEPGEGGDCSAYEMCDPGNGDGGGSGDSNDDPPKNPCEKAKTQITRNPKVLAAIKDLKDHNKKGIASNNRSEKSWTFPNDGSSPISRTNNDPNKVSLGDISKIVGAYHNHPGGLGVDIFSATDIAALIEIARYREVGNREDAFMGVVAPGNIHYLIRFTGTDDELPTYGSYSTEMLEKLKSEQWSEYQELILNKSLTKEQKLEIILFNTLSKMGLENKVTLQRIDENNDVSTVSQNQNGTINITPC